MAATLNWYEEQCFQAFGPIALSEARKVVMRQVFAEMVRQKSAQERTNSWQVPLELVFNDNGTYQVSIIDESSLLYLD